MALPSAEFRELDDWGVLRQFLPDGWEQKARDCGALTRARGIADASALLRVLLIHLANGCSLVETSVRAQQLGLGQLNSSAVYKRLRSSEYWLRWLAEQTRSSLGFATPTGRRRVRAVDATAVSEPGSTGTDWRIHYAINLANLQCDFFSLTDATGGETWRRIPVAPGDIMVGDRGYSTPVGVSHVADAGGDVVVRLNRQSLPLFDADGERLNPLVRARGIEKVSQSAEWPAWVQNPSGARIPGRLIVVRRNRQTTRLVREKLRKEASKKQYTVSKESWEAARYFFIWTTLPASYGKDQVLELYRCRWQIELAFKRMKSIMGLGHLPKKDPESSRAWLHGKLFVSLLVERLISVAKTFSPWGYQLV
jgi:DDE family transposase